MPETSTSFEGGVTHLHIYHFPHHLFCFLQYALQKKAQKQFGSSCAAILSYVILYCRSQSKESMFLVMGQKEAPFF